MFPSNAKPTISPFTFITGLPEFPPTMSFVLINSMELMDQIHLANLQNILED